MYIWLQTYYLCFIHVWVLYPHAWWIFFINHPSKFVRLPMRVWIYPWVLRRLQSSSVIPGLVHWYLVEARIFAGDSLHILKQPLGSSHLTSLHWKVLGFLMNPYKWPQLWRFSPGKKYFGDDNVVARQPGLAGWGWPEKPLRIATWTFWKSWMPKQARRFYMKAMGKWKIHPPWKVLNMWNCSTMVSGECRILGGQDCYSMGTRARNGIFRDTIMETWLEGTKYLSLPAGWIWLDAHVGKWYLSFCGVYVNFLLMSLVSTLGLSSFTLPGPDPCDFFCHRLMWRLHSQAESCGCCILGIGISDWPWPWQKDPRANSPSRPQAKRWAVWIGSQCIPRPWQATWMMRLELVEHLMDDWNWHRGHEVGWDLDGGLIFHDITSIQWWMEGAERFGAMGIHILYEMSPTTSNDERNV